MRHNSFQEQLEGIRKEMHDSHESHPISSSNVPTEYLRVKPKSVGNSHKETEMVEPVLKAMGASVTSAVAPRLRQQPSEDDNLEFSNENTITVKNGLGEVTLTITPDQKAEIVKNIIENQRASIKEKKGNFYVSLGLIVLTTVFSGVMVAGAYGAMSGKLDNSPN